MPRNANQLPLAAKWVRPVWLEMIAVGGAVVFGVTVLLDCVGRNRGLSGQQWFSLIVMTCVGGAAAQRLYLRYRQNYRFALSHAGRCPICGYDLRGVQADKCPECGSENVARRIAATLD